MRNGTTDRYTVNYVSKCLSRMSDLLSIKYMYVSARDGRRNIKRDPKSVSISNVTNALHYPSWPIYDGLGPNSTSWFYAFWRQNEAKSAPKYAHKTSFFAPRIRSEFGERNQTPRFLPRMIRPAAIHSFPVDSFERRVTIRRRPTTRDVRPSVLKNEDRNIQFFSCCVLLFPAPPTQSRRGSSRDNSNNNRFGFVQKIAHLILRPSSSRFAPSKDFTFQRSVPIIERSDYALTKQSRIWAK